MTIDELGEVVTWTEAQIKLAKPGTMQEISLEIFRCIAVLCYYLCARCVNSWSPLLR
jgi:hypothetical protein